MTDPTRADGYGESGVTTEVAKRATRWGLGRYTLGLAGCLAVALGIGLLVAFLLPREESAPRPNDAAVDARRAPPKAPPPPTPAPPVQPTVRLPSMGVPATVEQLQKEAEAVANELRDRFPDLPEALHVVAMLRAQLRTSGEAEELWQKCIELDPEQVRYYVNLAAIAMERGNSELAVETLERAVDAGCSSPDLSHHLAVALANLGRCEQAEAVVQEALSAYPRSASHWVVLGQAQLKLGKPAEAETSLRKAIELGSRSAAAYFALGNACAQQDKQEEAARYWKRFKELKASAPLDKQQRYEILSTAEARRTAVRTLSEAAAVHSRQGNSLESERLLLRAIALDPTNATPCQALAGLYHEAGMLPEERVVRRRLVEIEPYHFDRYVNLAKVCMELGEPESAEATLKLAVAARPEAAEGYATLAQFYLQQSKARKARWFAQEAIRREPTAEGYLFLASTCRVLGDNADAEAALAKARQLAPAGSPLPQTTPQDP